MRLSKPILALVALLLALLAPTTADALPRGFFGISPQTTVTDADAQYMHAGGIESVREPVPWPAVQPTPEPIYRWTFLDETVAVAARAGMRVLPVLGSTPHWLERKETTLPISDPLERNAWVAFVQAAVTRYGPHGTFWTEHGAYSADPVPEHPILSWQIWNEANFFYFTYPASPQRYAKLLELTAPVIRSVDPRAKLILSGLFGKPDQGGSRGMPASRFLAKLYKVPGITADFDGVALHPYAFDLDVLKRMVEGIHDVITANHDRVPLYITEMGWGSQNDFKKVAFEQGPQGQARELRSSYRYLIANQRRLRLKGVYWFSWKDVAGACSFCDSAGLFDGGPGFIPKPAWRAFVDLTDGRPRP
jgi:hypothetical protein